MQSITARRALFLLAAAVILLMLWVFLGQHDQDKARVDVGFKVMPADIGLTPRPTALPDFTKVVILAGSTPTPGSPANPTEVARQLIEAEKIPLHPDARKIDTTKEYRSQWSTASYLADPLPDKVAEFYRQYLDSHGWSVVRPSPETESTDPATVIVSRWGEELGAPWHLLLSVRISQFGGPNNRSEPTPVSAVTANLYRWPDMLSLPVPEGATGILIEDGCIIFKSGRHEGAVPVRFTTFSMGVSPAEVEDFYKSELTNIGWEYRGGRLTDISEGVAYDFDFWEPHNSWTNTLIVSAEERAGETLVTVRLTGAVLKEHLGEGFCSSFP